MNTDRYSTYGSGYFRGKEAERERIIGFLEDGFWHHLVSTDRGPVCLPSCDMCELIVLIKGENK